MASQELVPQPLVESVYATVYFNCLYIKNRYLKYHFDILNSWMGIIAPFIVVYDVSKIKQCLM